MTAQHSAATPAFERRLTVGSRSDRAVDDGRARSLEQHLEVGIERSIDAVIKRPMLTFLLLAAAQFVDLFTFGLAVDKWGPSGELGPLGLVYAHAGIFAVAIVKIGIVAIVLTVLARYPWQRAATPRRLALIVATIGVFGAFTNVAALI